LIAGIIAKSNGAKSGEYGGWDTEPNPSTASSIAVAPAVCEDALSM